MPAVSGFQARCPRCLKVHRIPYGGRHIEYCTRILYEYHLCNTYFFIGTDEDGNVYSVECDVNGNRIKNGAVVLNEHLVLRDESPGDNGGDGDDT